MNADIFIPARLASSRLPNKHLKQIDGIPIIKYLIDRLKTAEKIRNIIVCTTNLPSDDLLVEYLEKEKILFFRGSDKDILIRFLKAAEYFGTDIIIDVEGDKIYTDPFYVDSIVEKMENSNIDFMIANKTENNFEPTFVFHAFVPAGIRFSALKKICDLKKSSNTETGYKEFFLMKNISKYVYILPPSSMNLPKNLRLTLDYQADFDLAKEIFKELGNYFHFQDVIKLFYDKPKLFKKIEPLVDKWKKEYNEKITDLTFKI